MAPLPPSSLPAHLTRNGAIKLAAARQLAQNLNVKMHTIKRLFDKRDRSISQIQRNVEHPVVEL